MEKPSKPGWNRENHRTTTAETHKCPIARNNQFVYESLDATRGSFTGKLIRTRPPAYVESEKGRKGANLRLLLFRASFSPDEQQKAEGGLRPEEPGPTRDDVGGQGKEERSAKGIEITEASVAQEEIDWPQLRKKHAALQIPSFGQVDPSASHGGSTFQRKRLPQELVREKKGPSEHV